MRLMVLFDLPVETSQQRKEYRHFRKVLLNEGFVMIQYSVYVRVCINKQAARFMEKRISSSIPKNGLIQTMMVTEKQYNDMHFLSGEPVDDIRNSSERTIVL